jgi:hypothetical protein
MSNGVLLFANNNSSIDYIKQAIFLAKRIRKYLNLPTSIVTSETNITNKEVFDKIIHYDDANFSNKRIYNDVSKTIVLNFKNNLRPLAYDLSPYDQTILMDTDYIVCSDYLSKFIDGAQDFLIFKDGIDIGADEDSQEFKYIGKNSVDFYWATVVYFCKTEKNKIFFNLLKHIQENYYHYVVNYNLQNTMYRNDFAFSIAIHIMNSFGQADIFKTFPNPILYTLDKDELLKIDNNSLTFLSRNNLHKTDNLDIHVMNKFSLERIINEIA